MSSKQVSVSINFTDGTLSRALTEAECAQLNSILADQYKALRAAQKKEPAEYSETWKKLQQGKLGIVCDTSEGNVYAAVRGPRGQWLWPMDENAFPWLWKNGWCKRAVFQFKDQEIVFYTSNDFTGVRQEEPSVNDKDSDHRHR